MAKKWIFKEFVNNNEDTIGLVAYALYKRDKSDLADKLRNSGRNESEITKEVTQFHDYLSQQPERIKNYKQEAVSLLSKMAHSIEKSLRDSTQKEWKKERDAFYKKVQSTEQKERTVLARIVGWLLDGIKSVVATATVSTFLFGLAVMTTSEQTKAEILAGLIKQIAGIDLDQNERNSK